MIPQNRLSTSVIRAAYKSPDGIITNLVEDYELGGIAIQDTSKGLEYQIWKGKWDSETEDIILTPQLTGDPVVIQNVSDLVEFSFSFDQNMRWTTATLNSAGVLSHTWYDATIAGYTTSTYNNIASAKISLDDKRAKQITAGVTDVILTYIKTNNTLCWRVQRDRYATEYVRATLADNLRITNFGMSEVNRLQWRFSTRRR